MNTEEWWSAYRTRPWEWTPEEFDWALRPVMGIGSVFIDALAIKLLWLWFLVPVVPVVAPIGYWNSMGLALLVAVLVHRPRDTDPEGERLRRAGESLLQPIVAIAIGGLIHLIQT